MKKEIIDAIQKVIGYEFSNETLLIQAFTRESYAKEQRVKGLDCEGNEQLEFFGDTVLGYLVVSGAFDNFTNVVENTGLHVMYKEGKLSEFKSYWTKKERLSDAIDDLGLAQYLIMSKGDINQKAHEHKSVKEDLFEALVGAMWVDSGKDTKRIEPIVFNMLNIEFDKKTEKNFYSQLIEWADKKKYPLTKKVESVGNDYKVELIVDLTTIYGEPLFDGDDNLWSENGYGRTIKEAEQNAAKALIEKLDRYGNYEQGVRFQEDFTKETAINKLQEYAQKGEIGQVSYTDSLEFNEEKPYWKVTCHIANMSIVFDGRAKLKKDAKKEAAYQALTFMKLMMDGNGANEFNPLKKKEFFIVNGLEEGEETHLSVLVVDKYESLFYTGMMYPEKVEHAVYIGSTDENTYEDIIEACHQYAYYISPWYVHYICETPKEYIDDMRRMKDYIESEFDKLPKDIKENSLKVIEKMEDLIKKFVWHPTARKVMPTPEQLEENRKKIEQMRKEMFD